MKDINDKTKASIVRVLSDAGTYSTQPPSDGAN